MKVYIASPFFNEEEILRVEKLKNLLNHFELEYFSPKDESNLKFKGDSASGEEVFKINIEEIKKCDAVIAITNGKDTGTLFEAGLAYGLGKNIVYLYDGGESFNLMLSNSGIATTSFEELEEVLFAWLKGEFSYEVVRQMQSNKYKCF